MTQRSAKVGFCFASLLGLILVGGLVSTAAAQQTANEEFQEAMEAGDAYLQEGDLENAIASYSRAIQLNSFAPHGYAARANAFALAEDPEAALRDFKDALDRNPSFVPALVGRGEIYLQFNAAELALADFQLAAEQERLNPRVQFGLGKSQMLTGNVAAGVKTLDRFIEMDDQNAEAFRLRGQGQGALGRLDEALADIERSLALAPEDHETYFAKGTILLRNEMYEESIEALDQAIEYYVPDESGLPFAQGYLTKAAAHLEVGKRADDPQVAEQAYLAAMEDCDELMELLPSGPAGAAATSAAHFSRGVALRLMGQLGDAVEAFSEALKLNPDLAEAYFRRGICFHYMNEDALAIADFEQAAAINFEDPRARLWQGFTHNKVSNYNEAIRAYGKAIAKSERYVPAYVNRGLTYMRIGDLEKAIRDFNEAIRLEPTEGAHYYKRGMAYLRQGDRERAMTSFTNAIAFDDQYVPAYERMAGELEARGNTELAQEYRRRIEEIESGAEEDDDLDE